jgi:hypothetical protein
MEAEAFRMLRRKWLFRGMTLVLLASLIAIGWWVRVCISPAQVRLLALQQLQTHFPQLHVQVQSAHLRLFGGVAIEEFTLQTKSEIPRTLMRVPRTVIRCNRDALREGRMSIEQIRLERPELWLEADSAGNWNVDGLSQPPSTEHGGAPSLEILQGKVILFDRRVMKEPIHDLPRIDLSMLSDSPHRMRWQLNLNSTDGGKASSQGNWNQKRVEGSTILQLERFTLNESIRRVLTEINPNLEPVLAMIRGKVSGQIDLEHQQQPQCRLIPRFRLQLENGQYYCQKFQELVSEIRCDIEYNQGKLIVHSSNGNMGGTSIEVSGEAEVADLLPENCQPVNAKRSQPVDFESRLKNMRVQAKRINLSPEMFAKLPPEARSIDKQFQIRGPVNLSYHFDRGDAGITRKFTVEPMGATVCYEWFQLPLFDLRGKVEKTFHADGTEAMSLDLSGVGANRPLTIVGKILGVDPEKHVDITVRARDVPLDHAPLIDALPDQFPAMYRRFHAKGVADLVCRIRHNLESRRDYGATAFDNEFTLQIKDGSLNYDDFPLPLQHVNGELFIRSWPLFPTKLPDLPGLPAVNPLSIPDIGHVEFRNFTARHGNGILKIDGKKEPTTTGGLLTLNVRGTNVPWDQPLNEAMKSLRLDGVLQKFEPAGSMNCAIAVKVQERSDSRSPSGVAEFKPSEDLQLGMAFNGLTIRPSFFPYSLHGLAGKLTFGQGKLQLQDFSAEHGATRFKLPLGDIVLRPDGSYWAELREMSFSPLLLDPPMLEALPPGLRSACSSIELGGQLDLHVTKLVIDDKPTGSPGNHFNHLVARGQAPSLYPLEKEAEPRPAESRPTIYWDGRLTLNNAHFNTGVPWTNVNGIFGSRGRFESGKLGRVISNVTLSQANVAKQPIQDVVVRMEIDPEQPSVMRIPMLRGQLYGGEIGGEARLVLQSPLRYDLRINATRIRLDEFAKQQRLDPKTQLQGLATAQLFLQNPIDERTGKPVLQGGGKIDVPEGRLLNPPLILDLVKFLKMKMPDETFFDEAHVLFRIHDRRILIGQLDLLGDSISLGGEGEMNLDGTNMNLQFYMVWSRLNHLLSTPLGDFAAGLSRSLYKLIVEGELGSAPRIRQEPVPVVVEPIKRIMGRRR